MRREVAILIGVSVISIIAGVWVFQLANPPAQFASATHPVAVADLSYQQLAFPDIDGEQHALADWREPLQVINFWAPWCEPCRREIPVLIELQQQYAGQARFIGLAFDSANNVRNFAAEHPFNYPLLLVQGNFSSVNGLFGNASGGLPFTVILDAQREVVFRHAGEISRAELETRLEALLAAES